MNHFVSNFLFFPKKWRLFTISAATFAVWVAVWPDIFQRTRPTLSEFRSNCPPQPKIWDDFVRNCLIFSCYVYVENPPHPLTAPSNFLPSQKSWNLPRWAKFCPIWLHCVSVCQTHIMFRVRNYVENKNLTIIHGFFYSIGRQKSMICLNLYYLTWNRNSFEIS